MKGKAREIRTTLSILVGLPKKKFGLKDVWHLLALLLELLSARLEVTVLPNLNAQRPHSSERGE